MVPIQKGDIISFTLDNKREITVAWSQSLSSKSEPYYAIPAKNTSRDNADVNFFVQKNWFDNELSKFATVDGNTARVTITDKFQYGQKNDQGEFRFVVYHDTGRKPYQHRFIETTLLAKGGDIAVKLAKGFGYDQVGTNVSDFLKRFVGDYLHNF
ncbi:hypothetical protein K435DRAFT_791231 [Dendrothele bispora CBS 962.96]|uniref:Uncharacterized protein n=1 Tax=Dendrothele bispora (strain CBS 962.96) TaxID=1314807 RepID=A0A4S8MMC1_DENBC|nr:hypothetical protein K435DRAFT_791231 [Dendrothele bispora CBS 962.96]